MVNDSQQDDFERRAQAVLREHAEQLSGPLRSRLTQARYAALDAIGGQRDSSRRRWATPLVGATATAAFALLLTFNPVRHSGEAGAIGANADVLEIVTAEDSLEFYRDVEFYSWLDAVLEEEVTGENEA